MLINKYLHSAWFLEVAQHQVVFKLFTIRLTPMIFFKHLSSKYCKAWKYVWYHYTQLTAHIPCRSVLVHTQFKLPLNHQKFTYHIKFNIWHCIDNPVPIFFYPVLLACFPFQLMSSFLTRNWWRQVWLAVKELHSNIYKVYMEIQFIQTATTKI